MQPFWLCVVLNHISETITDGMILSLGFDETPHEEPSADALQCALLARARATSTKEAVSLVRDSLGKYDPVATNVISVRIEEVVRSERRAAVALEPGTVVLKDVFIGFKRDCDEARASAIRIIESAIRKKWWQFWR